MSPMIYAILKVCDLAALGGPVWVVCAPSGQGKTTAAESLIHGNHCMRPDRSLKIDARDMTNFPKDFAEKLNCGDAELCLSQLYSVKRR